MSFIRKSNAAIFLFVNAFLWGSSYVWSKMLLDYLPRFSILFVCALGGLISTFVLFYPSIRTIKRGEILPSMIISVFSIVSNTFFMFALQYTSSSNTAFIVQMSVIITPMLMALVEKKAPKRRYIISAVIALTGLFMLTCDFGNFRLKTGDLLALGNALFFSLFLVGLNINSKKVDAVHFTFIHHMTNTVGFLVLAFLFERQLVGFQSLKTPIFGLLVTASIAVAVLTVLIQSAAIKYVRPEKATIIYTFEPVTTLVLGYILMGEKLNGIKPVIGSTLILVSVLCSVYKSRAGRRKYSPRSSARPAME